MKSGAEDASTCPFGPGGGMVPLLASGEHDATTAVTRRPTPAIRNAGARRLRTCFPPGGALRESGVVEMRGLVTSTRLTPSARHSHVQLDVFEVSSRLSTQIL